MKPNRQRFYHQRLITIMERIEGGSVKAAERLGVGYNGSWAKWKRDPETLPAYMIRSLEAHVHLSKKQHQLISEWREYAYPTSKD